MSAADEGVMVPVVRPPSPPVPGAVGLVADVTLVATVGVFRVGRRVGRQVGRRGVRLAGSVVRVVPTPSLAPGSRSAQVLDDVAVRALDTRRSAERAASAFLDRVVPLVLDAVLDRTDLTRIVRERVDIDQIVAVADLDAAASRLDLDAVAKRLDIEAIIGRLDLVALTQEIMNALDIPEIIRESTTSVASGSVTEVRLQSISADEAVARVVDRFRLRRRPRSTNTLLPPPRPPS